VGVFRDDEFYEPSTFTKYRPTFKVNFYSPIGMQSLSINDLPADKQQEEIAFQEFVIKRHQQNNSNAPLWYLPFILIQLTLTFLTVGVYGGSQQLQFRHKYWLLHFLLNIILTSLIIGFILSLDKLYWTISLVALVVVINTFTAATVTRKHRFRAAAG
jgi:hypothetical protein